MTERGVSQGQSAAREQASRGSVESGKTSQNIMTQETHDRLVDQLNSARKELEEATQYLREGRIHGSDDFRDQGAFELALKNISQAAQTIEEKDSILRNHKIISPRLRTDKIKRGNSALVRIEGDEEPFEVTLLGEHDAGIRIGWTHPGTPLGGAILDRKAGDQVVYAVGRRQKTVYILEVLPGQFEGPREPSQKPQAS